MKRKRSSASDASISSAHLSRRGGVDPAAAGDSSLDLYQYKPLQDGQIRVLVLQPGTFGEPLVARIEHVLLADAAYNDEPTPPSSRYFGSDESDTGEDSTNGASVDDDMSVSSSVSRSGMSENDSGEDFQHDVCAAMLNELFAADVSGPSKFCHEQTVTHQDPEQALWSNGITEDRGAPSSLPEACLPSSSSEDVPDAHDNIGDDYESESKNYIIDNDEQTLHYEAISYAWGDAVFPEQITIAQTELSPSSTWKHPHKPMIPVTTSLFQALQRFRFEDRPRRLWADGICINQGDTTEKSTQVVMMGQIYSRAHRVLAWLGESEGHDWLGLALLRCLLLPGTGLHGFDVDRGRLDEILESGSHCQCCAILQPMTSEDLYSLSVASLRVLSTRSYIKRLRVLQELALAKQIWLHSGCHAIWFGSRVREPCLNRISTWQIEAGVDYNVFLRQFPKILRMPADDFGSSIMYLWIWCMGHPAISRFVFSLKSNWSHMCRDPRDRIFATRSVNEFLWWDDMEPDYSLSVVEVFRRATYNVLWKSQDPASMAVLAMAASTRHRDEPRSKEDWPSWVPDYHSLDPYCTRLLQDRYLQESVLSQCPAIFSQDHVDCSLGASQTILRLGGRTFGQIFAICPISRIDEAAEWTLNHDQSFMTAIKKSSDEPDGQHPLHTWLETCSRFLVLRDYVHFEEGYIEQDSYWTYVRTLLHCMHHFGENEDPAAAAENATCVENILRMRGFPRQLIYTDPTRSLAMIRTPSNIHVGWVTSDTQVGDEICIIYGCPWPFVIRKVPDTDDYIIIGDAFFPYLKEAEAIGDDIEKQGKLTFR